MPTKTKAARKPVRATKNNSVTLPSFNRTKAVVATNPGRKNRYSLAPLILSGAGIYLLFYFGFLANLSTFLQSNVLGWSGIEALQANLWAFVGMFAIVIGLVLFVVADRWYEQKAYVTVRSAFAEDIAVLGSVGFFILATFMGSVSQELFGVSANIVLLFVILLAVVVMIVMLLAARRNAQSLPLK